MNRKAAITSVTAAAAVVLLLSGCGQNSTQSATSARPSSAQSTTAAPATSSAAPSPSSSSSAASTPAASTPAASGAAAGPALCKAADLKGALDSTGGGAAGSVYMKLVLTNSGAQPCLLKGFAGVSLTAGADGDPIGAAATRDDSTPAADVLLAPGHAGSATLRYTQAGNHPDCTRTPAAGFRVYPPEDTASLFLPAPKDACSNAGINLLTIGAFAAM